MEKDLNIRQRKVWKRLNPWHDVNDKLRIKYGDKPPYGPDMVYKCPNCREDGEAVIWQVNGDYDDVTFKCECCREELKLNRSEYEDVMSYFPTPDVDDEGNIEKI